MSTTTTRRIFHTGATILFFAILSTVTTMQVSAQATQTPALYAASKRDSARAAKSLAVVMYQVDNSLKFRVHFENYSGKDVSVYISDKQGKIIYRETVRNRPKYIRKFDLNKLSDGNYTFVVSNRNQTFTGEVQLQTSVSRTASMHKPADHLWIAGQNAAKAKAGKSAVSAW